MAETADKTYAVTAANAAAGAPNSVAVVNDGTGDRQIVVLGAGDGTTTLNDGSATLPLNTKITDGTNLANILKSDGTAAGQNAQLVAPAVQTITFTTSTPGAQTILANTDVSHYSWIEVTYTSVGPGLALTGQFSQTNGGTYVNTATWSNSNGSVPPTGLATAASITYYSVIHGNYFQIAVSALTSGTFAGTVTLHTTPLTYDTIRATQNGTWTVGSNSATGSAVPANAFYGGVKALTTSPTAATTGNLVGLTGDVMGEALVSSGGLVTTSVPANASNVVVKGSAGRLCRLLVTTTGVTAMLIYDNATTNSGTLIGALPASAAIGGVYDFEMPAANGITIAGSATNPAVTVSWI
jgi:hypothetical protein